jgi:hypothetical protein
MKRSELCFIFAIEKEPLFSLSLSLSLSLSFPPDRLEMEINFLFIFHCDVCDVIVVFHQFTLYLLAV